MVLIIDLFSGIAKFSVSVKFIDVPGKEDSTFNRLSILKKSFQSLVLALRTLEPNSICSVLDLTLSELFLGLL